MSRDTTGIDLLFGQRVRELRKKMRNKEGKRLTQKELAEEAEVEQKTISRIENVKTDPKSESKPQFDTKNLQDIARALGTTLPELLDTNESKTIDQEEKQNTTFNEENALPKDTKDKLLDWDNVYESISLSLQKGISVNLTIPIGTDVENEVKNKLGKDKNFGQIAIVNLERGAVANRRGFVREILYSLNITIEIPEDAGEELVILEQQLKQIKDKSGKLPLIIFLNFDYIEELPYYNSHTFSMLRNLVTNQIIILLLVSVKDYALLVPKSYTSPLIPFNSIELKLLNN